MTPKQQRFVAEYLIDLNATQAAIRAGYSPKTASSQGERLLRNVEVAKALEEGKAKQLEAANLSAGQVLEAIRRRLAGDPRKLFDEKGNPRPIHSLSPEEASLLAGYELVIKNAKAGDGHQDEVLKIRLVDSARYVEMAAKHFDLLKDRVEVEVKGNLVQLLEAGRKRVRDAGSS